MFYLVLLIILLLTSA